MNIENYVKIFEKITKILKGDYKAKMTFKSICP
jgi:hypothetical protein